MKLPHVVSVLTKEVYETCQPMRISNTEKHRKITADCFEWDDGKYPHTLVHWAILSLSKVFKSIQPLDQILPRDLDTFMEYYPPDIDFKYTVPIIQDEHYWMRAYKNRWPDKKELHSMTDWKNRFLSALLQEYLENASADVFNADEANELAALVHPYIKTLKLTQLQIVRKPFLNVEIYDSNGIEDCCPYSVENIVDHIPLQSVLQRLIHLEELSITFGVNNLQDRYEKRYFEFSHADCNSICSGLRNLKKIRILRINRSSLDCSKVRLIMRQLLEVESLEEIDFSHCMIGDIGALSIGGYLQEHPNLKILRLCNNRMGDLGFQGIAYSIQQNLKAPLDTLDLRLNTISLVGAGYLASALVRCKEFPVTLNIAACGLIDESAKKMVSMLTLNRSLRNLDMSSNNLHGAEEDIITSVTKNRKIVKIDLRCTGINEETLQNINAILDRNINLVGKDTTASSEIPPLYLNEPEYLIWDYNPNNPDYEPGHYPERILAG